MHVLITASRVKDFTMLSIQITDLKKYYGDTKAVDGINLKVHLGEIFGLLGPNGAGKTTTVEIMEGLTKADSGQVYVQAINIAKFPRKVKAQIGVQLQSTALYPRLTVRELIDLFRSFFPGEVRDTDDLIALVNLHDKQNTLSKNLSGGQRQRLSVALALVNKSKVVFLDEPTTGLDPQARLNMWAAIRSIKNEGVTIFLTTHYIEEAQTLCERIAIMDYGKIIALDSPGNLINQHYEEAAVQFVDLKEKPDKGAYQNLTGVTHMIHDRNQVTLFTTNTAATLGRLIDLSKSGIMRYKDLNVRRATLEDVFLNLTGRRIRD
jgi:ABC-2 type transport system ATP-binding protein